MIETRYDFPKLKVPVQTFIPKHLKNKIEKNQLNIIKEETKSDKTLSLFKDINNKKEYWFKNCIKNHQMYIYKSIRQIIII